MKNQIILIYNYKTSNEKIIHDVQLLKELNYQTIIIKLINSINSQYHFIQKKIFLIMLKKIEDLKNLHVLWNIEINKKNINLLENLKNKKYPIFIDYFFQEKENEYLKLKKYQKNIERLDANILENIDIDIEQTFFNHIDYYPKNFSQISKEINDKLNEETIILYFKEKYFLYLFGNNRFLQTELSYNSLNNYMFYQKEIIKWILKKQQKNKICKNCNFFYNCHNDGFFIFKNPTIFCQIQEYLKNNH